jgi:hypothetical protein
VIAQVNAALASGDRATILSVASALDTANNAGCPINQQGVQAGGLDPRRWIG